MRRYRRYMASRRWAGFSLVESLVAGVVLGVGVMALNAMYVFSIKGTSQSERAISAMHLAQTRAERLATSGLGQLPNCPQEPGCRLNSSELRAKAAKSGNYPCSQLLNQSSTQDPGDDVGGIYRIDTSILAPQGAEQLDSARVIAVSVCWKNSDNSFREYRSYRLKLPEF